MRRALGVGLLTLAGCSGGGPTDSRDPPPVTPAYIVAHVTLLQGDAQTGVAGTVLEVPLVIEVRNRQGAVMPGMPLRVDEIAADGSELGGLRTLTPTDAAGRSSYAWEPVPTAGPHRLRIVAAVSDTLVADTAAATVLAGPAWRLAFTTPDQPEPIAFLGESLDLAPLVDSVLDQYGNPVTVQTMEATATSPITAVGTSVSSATEVDRPVRLLVNGVRFDIRVHIVRDLRELAGAHGGWSCSSQLGAVTLDPAVSVLRTDVTAVLDSVAYGRDGFRYKFYFDMRWTDRYSDGTTGSGEGMEIRNVLSQNAGGWFWAYGPWMSQTGSAPLSYVQTSELECDAWSRSGPMVNEPFWLTK